MPRDLEIAELIADVKEHVLYLQELGVDVLNVDLPQLSVAQIRSRSVAAKSVPPALSGGAEPDIRSTSGYIETRPPAPASGSDLPTPAAVPRAGARLAALPSLSKRKPTAASGVDADRLKAPDNDMTKAKESTETTANPSMAELPIGGTTPTRADSVETMEDIWADIGNCKRCPLSEGRTQIVQTTGNFNADLMFIGEAPGADEDKQGEPFVGRAGQLLNKIIEAIGMTREEVAIGNINRCRPPGNRAPTLPEAHTCRPFLLREIAVIKPKVIVVMGNTALHNLLDTKDGITKVRGRFQDYFGVKVMPTFHPAYLLRDPHKKRDTWEDMKMVRDYLNSMG